MSFRHYVRDREVGGRLGPMVRKEEVGIYGAKRKCNCFHYGTKGLRGERGARGGEASRVSRFCPRSKRSWQDLGGTRGCQGGLQGKKVGEEDG